MDPVMIALLLAVSVLAGLLGALFGIGGGIIFIPVLTIGFGLSATEAAAVSLVGIVATSAGSGAYYAEKKVGKLDRYFKADAEAAIVFSVEKGRNNVELTIRSGGTIIRVAESTSDMFATIDAAVSSVERRLRRNKTRLEKRLRQDAFTRSVDVEELSSFAPVNDEEEYHIVRTKRFPIKPMTVDEAVLQMELLGHTFFAFKDVDQDGRFSVVYKRNDGDYGLIEDDA